MNENGKVKISHILRFRHMCYYFSKFGNFTLISALCQAVLIVACFNMIENEMKSTDLHLDLDLDLDI